METTFKQIEIRGWIKSALFFLLLVCVTSESGAQTKTMKIFVKDASGGLESSQQSPSAPLLDSNFVQNPLFNLLDTSGVDSITLYNPNWAGGLDVRPGLLVGE